MEYEGEIWIVPTEIDFCLDSNLYFLLKSKKDGNKRIFSSEEIKNKTIQVSTNKLFTNILSNNNYIFNKYTGQYSSDIFTELRDKNTKIYYKDKIITSDILNTPGTYHITGYNKTVKNLYSINISDSSCNDYIPSIDKNTVYVYISRGAKYSNINGFISAINDIVNNPSLETITNYYNFNVTDGKSAPELLSSANNYIIGGFTIPHWDLSATNLSYYGALSQISKNKKVVITICKNVVLPFGLSNLKIENIRCNKSTDNKYLYLQESLIQRLKLFTYNCIKQQPTVIKDEILLGSNFNQLLSFEINGGGIIYGGIINNSTIKHQLNIPHNNSWPRADNFGIYRNNINLDKNFINSIQYWTLAGLLEINAQSIKIDNISVVGGIPRGISATQLNAYNTIQNTLYKNLYNYVLNDNKLKIDVLQSSDNLLNATINNSEFVLNSYSGGQADGLDSVCTNTFTNLYIQAIDDCFKIASSTTATNITILSGNAGGAINIGAYGYNKPITKVDVSYIYLHELDKNQVGDGCHYNYISPNYYWPGPSVIFAPYYPTQNNIISGNNINIKNIYYPVIDGWTPSPEQPFFSGGFLSTGFDPTDPLNLNTSNSTWNIITNIPNADDHSFNYVYSNMKIAYGKIMTGKITININNKYLQSTNECQSSPPVPRYLNQQWNGTSLYSRYTITYKQSCDTHNKNCLKCMDLFGSDQNNGTMIGIWDCNGRSNQQWSWLNGSNLITAKNNSNKCIDLPGGDTTNGNKLWIWDCNGSSNQNWSYNKKTLQIQYTADPKKCIDVPGGYTNNGTQLQIWDCNQ